MTATTTPIAPFTWNRNYNDVEQVRPYYPAFAAIHAELEAAGHYPYDDSFKGRIEGLTGQEHEDTGIYLLQTMHSREQDARQAEAFAADGARPLTDFEVGKVMRGDLARRGWYMGGTGWEVLRDVRVLIKPAQSSNQVDRKGTRVATVLYKKPRQRTWRTHHLSVDHYTFRPAS